MTGGPLPVILPRLSVALQLEPAGFDRMVLDCVVRGDPEPLFALSDAEIIEQAGNGGLEIRNLACAMGALPGRSGALIAYHNEPDWVAGLGFAEIHAAA